METNLGDQTRTWVSGACCDDGYHGGDQICAADFQDEINISVM